MKRHTPDWQRQRDEHKALLRASRTGLDNLVSFTGKRSNSGLLIYEVWSKTRPTRWIVQANDDGIPQTCTCENPGICSHEGAVYLFTHPAIKEVKPLPDLPKRELRPSDRDWTQDPEEAYATQEAI